MGKKGTCKICDMDNRKKIEFDLLRGVPYEELSNKYKVSKYILSKHKRYHIVKNLSDSMGAELVDLRVPDSLINTTDIPQITNVKDCLEYLHKEFIRIKAKAEGEENLPLSLQALKCDMDCIGLVIKSQELILSYQSQSSWEKILPKILEAVKPYPEVKIAIANALEGQ